MPWLPRQCIVVPIDFSAESLAALRQASEMVGEPSCLHTIHVLPSLDPAEPGMIWATVDDEGRKHHAADALRAELKNIGFPEAQAEVEIGEPGHEIARYAQSVKADLIVMPSHGRTGLKHLLIGSV